MSQKQLPNIEYLNSKINPTIDSGDSMYMVEFFKGNEYFSNLEAHTAFVKDVEKIVRNNKKYKAFIAYLKEEIKLDHCQVLSRLSDEDCTIEMHHGPIFTLFDYVTIILDHHISKKRKITTFRIADAVLEEHLLHNIQVVMLSKTLHEEVHNRNMFINMNHAYGDLGTFITKYKDSINTYQKEKYNQYIDRSHMMPSDDNGLLKLNDYLFN